MDATGLGQPIAGQASWCCFASTHDDESSCSPARTRETGCWKTLALGPGSLRALCRFGTEVQCAEAIKLARWRAGRQGLTPALWLCRTLFGGSRRAGVVPVDPVSASDVRARRQSDGSPQSAAHDVVLGYLPHQPGKTGLSALALKRHLRVSYPTAWLLNQNICRAVALREGQHRLDGLVQLDDAYLSEASAPMAPSRGSENKVPFGAASSVDHQSRGRPRHLKLNLVSGFTSHAIGQWAKTCLERASAVRSAGPGCFALRPQPDAVTCQLPSARSSPRAQLAAQIRTPR